MIGAKHAHEKCTPCLDQADEVARPSHYAAGEIECKEAMRAALECAPGLPSMAYVWWGFAFKYLWRWNGKDGLKDLRKCQQCIEFLIAELEGGTVGN